MGLLNWDSYGRMNYEEHVFAGTSMELRSIAELLAML